MATNPLQSAGRRFSQKFGVAFFWALVFGLVLGGASYWRLERLELTGDLRWYATLRLWLERLEWVTWDWRARELGALSSPSDDVVIVSVDDETQADAREHENPEWAMRPWPRDLAGSVVEQVLREGASSVLFDVPVDDVSPHHCTPCRADPKKADDDMLAERFDRHAGQVVLAWQWSTNRPRLGDRPLMPVLVKLGETDDLKSALPLVREVLRRRTVTYVVPNLGKHEVWAGVSSDAKAHDLASAVDPKMQVVTRALLPGDDVHEVSASWLAVQLAAVNVPGLDPDRLWRVHSLEAPVPSLASPWAGAATLVPDADGRVRSFPLFVAAVFVAADGPNGHPVILASAPLLAVMQKLGEKTLKYENGQLLVGSHLSIPVDPDGVMPLRFDTEDIGRAGQGTVKHALPAFRLLVNREDDEVSRGIRHHDNELQHKIVVFADRRLEGEPWSTPIGPASHSAVLAQAIANMLRGRGVTRVAPEADFWLTLAFAFVGAVLAVAWSSLVRRPGWLAWVATLAVVAGLHALVARQLFVEQLRWVAMAAPLLACAMTFLATLGYARTLEQSLRDFVLRALGGAVRDDVFSRVERDLALMRPERRELTVYFSDIEGFTAVAQDRDPGDVVQVLRAYLNEMTTVVLDSRGHVDKYLGDGLMVFWGAPVALDNQVAVACRAALELHRRFEAKRPEWEKRCGRPLALRAGLDAGPTVVGEMGTHHRVNYTVMGEPVATSFRLEALAKRYHARILVGPHVPLLAGPELTFREVDRLRFGRSLDVVRIYELVAVTKELGGDDRARLETWAQAMTAFHERSFAQAQAAFASLAANDPLAARYVKRCEAARAAPPPPTWDGTCRDDETDLSTPAAPKVT